VSILQAEFSLTQVLDRPLTGRVFFEEVIRENLDLGRPSQVQLIFDRRVNRRTPGRFRSRVITEGVVPSLYVDYKSSRIKQYHKEGRALRTETTINHTRDFGIGKQLKNLPALRQIGFKANRRLLDVQTIPMIARSVKRRLRKWYGPSRWRGNGLRRCVSEMDVYKRCSASWCCSACKRGVSPIATCEPCWLNCWVSTRPITPRAG
jgi:hypothetical protein